MAKKKRKSRAEQRAARENAIQKQLKELDSVENRIKHLESIGHKDLVKRLKNGKNVKREETKKNGTDIKLIHSVRTMKNYACGWSLFCKWLAPRITAEEARELTNLDIEKWTEYVNEYIQHLINTGKSPDTQATYKSAITKVLQAPSTAFISTEPRIRGNKKNNRLKDEDDRLSEEKNRYWKKIVSATGLRKDELIQIQGNNLYYNEKRGLWYLHITKGTKGGRPRHAPILATDKEELQEIIDLFRLARDKRVFQVPTALKPHKYRADYAKRVYMRVARDIKDIKIRKEKIYLRKELKGVVLDRKACEIVTKALGHNRGEEFPKSYAYKIAQ